MKVVVASKNPVKAEAARRAFQSLFPGVSLELITVDAESGVADQPDSDEETRRGAKGRIENARRMQPEADYWAGFEGGIEDIDGQLMAFAWTAVAGRSGFTSEARSATLPLPPAVRDLVARGFELGEANDRVFSTSNSKQGGGAYGLLTDGMFTREDIYTQTLILALIPFTHALFPHATQNRPR